MLGQNQQRHGRVRASGIAGHVRTSQIAFTCQVEELSEDGAFLLTDQRLAVGADLVIAFVKPGGRKALRLNAHVSRVVGSGDHHSPGLDIAFTSVGKADAERLVEWLDEMTLRSGGREKAAIHVAEKAPGQIAENAPIRAAEKTAPLAPAAPPPLRAVEPRAAVPSQQEAKLLLQLKGLVHEQDQLREQLRLRDAEIAELRRALETAEKFIGLRR